MSLGEIPCHSHSPWRPPVEHIGLADLGQRRLGGVSHPVAGIGHIPDRSEEPGRAHTAWYQARPQRAGHPVHVSARSPNTPRPVEHKPPGAVWSMPVSRLHSKKIELCSFKMPSMGSESSACHAHAPCGGCCHFRRPPHACRGGLGPSSRTSRACMRHFLKGFHPRTRSSLPRGAQKRDGKLPASGSHGAGRCRLSSQALASRRRPPCPAWRRGAVPPGRPDIEAPSLPAAPASRRRRSRPPRHRRAVRPGRPGRRALAIAGRLAGGV